MRISFSLTKHRITSSSSYFLKERNLENTVFSQQLLHQSNCIKQKHRLNQEYIELENSDSVELFYVLGWNDACVVLCSEWYNDVVVKAAGF